MRKHGPKAHTWRPLLLLANLFSLCLNNTAQAGPVNINVSGGNTLQFAPGGPFSLPRDAANGTVLANAATTLSASGFSGTCEIRQTFTSTSTETAPGSGIFESGVSGIGVKLYAGTGAARTQITGSNGVEIVSSLAGPENLTGISAELIVSGQVSGSAATPTLSNLPMIQIAYVLTGANNDASCDSLSASQQTIQTAVANPNVEALTCTVTNANLSVTLPTISAHALSAANKTAGATRFFIPLNCSAAGANVYVTLTDASNPGNTSALLGLAADSTAENVQLEILRENGTAINYGPESASASTMNQWLVGPSGEVTGIPLTVRYVSINGPATAGTVKAQALLTMSYQ